MIMITHPTDRVMQPAPLVTMAASTPTLWHCDCAGLLYGSGLEHETWCRAVTLANAPAPKELRAWMARGALDGERSPAHWDGEHDTLTVRASALTACRRMLALYASGTPESDPPGEDAQMRMDVGKVLETVVIQAMRRAGWNTTSYSNQRPAYGGGRPHVGVELADGIIAQGTPDGRVRVNRNPAVLEVKTHGGQRYRQWETMRVIGMNMPALTQAGVYRLGLVEGKEVGPLSPMVFAVMNTDTRQWDLDFVEPRHGDAAALAAGERLTTLKADIKAQRLPLPEYAPGAPECKRCPMVSVCGNGGEPEPEWTASNDAEFERLTLRFEQAREDGYSDAILRSMRQGLADYLQRNGKQRHGRVSLIRRTPTTVDYKRLAELLTPAQYAEVVSQSEQWTVQVGRSGNA